MVDLHADESLRHLPASAAAVVAGFTGSVVRSSERIYRGMMTFKVRVRTEHGDDIVVRFYPTGRSHLVLQEPDLLARCARAGLRVPEVIGDSRSGPSALLSYVAYRHIEGETLADRLADLDHSQRRSLAAELASQLSGLQQLSFEGAGELVTGTTAREASWAGFVESSMRTGLEATRRQVLLEPPLGAALERVFDQGPPVPLREHRRLVWGDINFENILVADDGSLAGLIDFEGCISGDPLATLGYCMAMQGPHPFFTLLADAAHAGPADDAEKTTAWYALLRAMRLARYAHLPLPTGRRRDPLIQIVPGLAQAISLLDPMH